ncbi:globin [uncultured Nitrospira sp.]|uniref:globin n=1 Tax=uncultured Nitrospira sp. TaxID=157176 RepID=UPI00314068F6
MRQVTPKFSNTEIYILECGLRWIKEDEDAFADKLFHRLVRDHPEVSTFLQTIGLQPFSRRIVQILDTIIREIRLSGKIRSPIGEQWKDLLPTTVDHLKPDKLLSLAETYLDIFSELAEDAWSPAMEHAWRKIIYEASISLWGTQPDSPSPSAIPSAVHFIKRGNNRMNQPFAFLLGAFMILAGGIASINLWSRYRLAEVKLSRKPRLKKVWC